MRATKSNLPSFATQFIGRTLELARIASLLRNDGYRLLTLVGAGGVGKTRLAVEVGSLCTASVYFVPLQPLTSPESIVSAIAEAIGFQFNGAEDSKYQLLQYLRDKSVLLILDNFEHLLDGVVLLSEIFSNAPGVQMLVTSRERLNLIEEHVYRVGGLSFPTNSTLDPGQDDAMQLFIQTARRSNTEFVLNAEQTAHMIRICQLVDGMPLALELAAHWTRLLSCKELASEIEQCLGILTTTAHNIEPRHRNIHVVFTPTWQRLLPSERNAFMALSVFRGPFKRQAAEMIAGISVHELAALIDKCLLRMNNDGYYDLHELLRQYSEEQLLESGEAWEQVHFRHCHYYAQFMQSRWEQLCGTGLVTALQEIEAEHANVLAGWEWALAQGYTLEIEMMLDSLWFFYDTGRRFSDGEQIFQQAAIILRSAQHADERHLLGKVLARQGSLMCSLTRHDHAILLIQESLEILREDNFPRDRAFALLRMGIAVFWAKGHQKSREYFEQSLHLYQQERDQWGSGSALFWLGIATEFDGDLEMAWKTYQASLAILRLSSSAFSIASVTSQMSQIATKRGNDAEALRLAQESLALFLEADIVWGIAMSYDRMALALMNANRFLEARRYIVECLVLSNEYILPHQKLLALGRATRLRYFQGRYDEAIQIIAQLLMCLEPQQSATYLKLLDEIKDVVTPDIYLAASEQGGARNLDEMAKTLVVELRQEIEQTAQIASASYTLPDPLTDRELEILHLIADGVPTGDVAERLCLSIGTVRWYLKQIYSKLSVSSRIQAIVRARELKLLP